MKRNAKSGFELVEVMVAVAIIALVAAVTVPAYKQARANQKARAQGQQIHGDKLDSQEPRRHARTEAADTQDPMPAVIYDGHMFTHSPNCPKCKGT